MRNTKEVALRITKVLESLLEEEGLGHGTVMVSIHSVDYARMVAPEVHYQGGRIATPYVVESQGNVMFFADDATVPPEELEVTR